MKRLRSIFVICLTTIMLMTAACAQAARRLEIVQARQDGSQLILYALLTDADTGAVVSPDFADVQVTAGALGGGTVTHSSAFRNTGENTAYAVVVDLNRYALNAHRLDRMKEALKTLLVGMREGDRMLLMSAGGQAVTPLTDGFEGDRLKLQGIIDGMTNTGSGNKTMLFSGLERALSAFSSTADDFPTRKVLVALAYGADGSNIAADVMATKAAASGIPAYFVTMRGTSDGQRKNADTTDLDRIARASHGRVINGHENLSTALALLREYVGSTGVLTIQPDNSAWAGLSGSWRVSANVGGETVTNDRDMDFDFTLRPSPTPEPTPTPAPTQGPTPTTAATTAPTVAPLMQTDAAEEAVTSSPVPAVTASPAPTLLDRLTSPPLMYVAIGAIALLLLLLVMLVSHRRKEAAQRKLAVDDFEDAPVEPVYTDPGIILGEGDRSVGLWSTEDGEKTAGMYDVDLDATLGMDQRLLKVVAEVTYQGETRQVPLRMTKEVTFGRGKDCAIKLDDPHVSRKHGKLVLKPDGLYVQDMGSLSGTQLNGQQVVSETPVRHGDVIAAGSTTIKIDILP